MLEFFISLVGVAIIIFLLSLLQYGIDQGIPYGARHANKESNSTDESKKNISESYGSLVADAIHTYRRGRHTDERERAKRERATIVVLFLTAIFAAAAAIAAGISAWVFGGQLGEMRKETIAANRAWISPVTARVTSPIDITHDLVFAITYKNTGKEPANNFAGPPKGEEFGSINMPTAGQTLFDVFKEKTIINICDTTVVDTNITIYQNVAMDYKPYIGSHLLSPEMISGQQPFFIHGCFTYHSPVSGEQIDKSEYCFLFLSAYSLPISCPHGNNAK